MLSLSAYRDTWTETAFQQAIINMAHSYGFKVAHFRPVKQQRRDGSVRYLTPVQADGAGFPDLVLAKAGRVLFFELKAKGGRFSEEQKEWLFELRDHGFGFKPADWEKIEELLRGEGS